MAEPDSLEVCWEELQGRPVLLVTHPTVLVVRSIQALLRQQLLDIPDVAVVGVYHEHECEKYEATRAYLRSRPDAWPRLHPIQCTLDDHHVFCTNPCTTPFDDLFSHSSAVLFTGGADVPPSLYGAHTNLTTLIRSPVRQWWEISMLAHLLGTPHDRTITPLLQSRPHYAVLGVCMGMQAMNVAAGGTLIQDIASEVYGIRDLEGGLAQDPDEVHQNFAYQLYPAADMFPATFHRVRRAGDGHLWPDFDLGADPVLIMSAHHQALGKLADDFELVATSMDGKIPEAIRHRHFASVLGVQFHPEYDVLWDAGRAARAHPDDPAGNTFYRRLHDDGSALRFHRSFWLSFSRAIARSFEADTD